MRSIATKSLITESFEEKKVISKPANGAIIEIFEDNPVNVKVNFLKRQVSNDQNDKSSNIEQDQGLPTTQMTPMTTPQSISST